MTTTLSYEDIVAEYIEKFGDDPVFDVTNWGESPDRMELMLSAIDSGKPLTDSNEAPAATY